MNKQGHVALAVSIGSAALMFPFIASVNVESKMVLVLAAAIGGLAPDLDHKTSTSSQLIQFSAKKRRMFRNLSCFSAAMGLLLYMLQFVSSGLSEFMNTWMLWLGAAILFFLLARLRNLVLIGTGAILLVAYSFYAWHWITAFMGLAFLILPVVKHRGIIHTPEFAFILSMGLIGFSSLQPELVQMFIIGFVIGWWAHLLGDIFGSDGIHSLLLPKLGIALHLFRNGGPVERSISRVCWLSTILMLGCVLLNIKI